MHLVRARRGPGRQGRRKIGKVFTVGLGTPKSMAPYLQDGSSSASILWDVQNLGTSPGGPVCRPQGKDFQASNNVSSKMPAIQWDSSSKTLLLGPR